MIKVPNYHFVGDGKGGWIKKPGRLKMRLSVHEQGPGEIIAAEITRSSVRLQGHMLEVLRVRLAAFGSAYSELNMYLSTPLGDIPVQADGAKIRNLWHLYLVRGRELIDCLGSFIHLCFRLKDRIHGLNEKKLSSLKNLTKQLSGKLGGIEELQTYVEHYETFLVKFISLRNRDKERNDTLVEPPFISEIGAATEGILNIGNGETFEFVRYFYESYRMILQFCCCLLGAELPKL